MTRMSRYYCPFCSPGYQFHQIRTDGVLICGQCGDPLIKKPLISLRQILGLLATSAFLIPFLLMLIIIIKDFTKYKIPSKSETLVLLSFK